MTKEDLVFGLITTTFVFSIFLFLYAIYMRDTMRYNDMTTFKSHCIEAGGVPVFIENEKSYTPTFLCVNPSAIIELKEDVK